MSKIEGFVKWVGICLDGKFFYSTIPFNNMAVILSLSVISVFIFTCFIISIELSYGPYDVNESIFA